MRVAIWHNLPSGGGKRALYDQVEGLKSRGHEVESWCPPSADQDFLPIGQLIPEHVVPYNPPHSRRLSTIRNLILDRRADIDAMDEHCKQCANEISEGRFDVLLAHSCMFFRATAIGRFAQIPSVLYQHEPYRWLYEALPLAPWAADERQKSWMVRPPKILHAMNRSVSMRNRAIQVREEVRNASGFQSILCNSLYSRESILRAYGISAEVCYLGVDAERLSPGVEMRQSFFLTVGAGVPEKNISFLIRALAQRSDKSWPLIWVANVATESYVEEIRELSRDLGVRLEFRRDVGHEELLSLYRAANLFLYSPRLEPFGLAPLEAASCGLPTVAVAEAGTRETVAEGRSGFLVRANEATFAAKIDEVLARPELLRSMASSARAYIEADWSLDAASSRLESVLVRLLTSVKGDGTDP